MRRTMAAGFILATLVIADPAAARTNYNAAVEPAVENYFTDIPVMISIAQCESQFHQFNSDGSVLHGGYKNTMIGIYQIAPLHLPDAASRGYDLNTIPGNMAYARHLYDIFGTSPWLASFSCWKKLIGGAPPQAQTGGAHSATAPKPLSDAETEQKIADLQWQIARLQAVIHALLAARSMQKSAS